MDDFIQRFLSSPEQTYKAALDILNKHQFPTDADWNTRYRAKLQELGLCLRFKATRPYHIKAPRPAMGHRHQWPRDMYIVEAVPIHPLHEEEWYTDANQQTIYADDPDRFTGRTTALALRIIHDAIVCPGQKIDIIDHTTYRRADVMLADQIQWMIRDLKLRHLWVEKSQRDEFTLIFERRIVPEN